MKKIEWCCKKKNGIELVEPNSNLAQAYIIKAESSLETSRLARSKDWKISAAYYAIYFSLYSILQKLGIKCEIHSCTITFAKEFLQEYFSKEQFDLLEKSFDARQDMQYYVDREVDDRSYNEILNNAALFISYCRNVSLRIDERNIKKIREELIKRIKKQ